MIKTDLPVILLKGILLLPNNDIRLEFSNDDSKNIIGSHKDRHANIGYGTIGFDNLINVAYNKRLEGIPFILETPYINRNTKDERAPYREEIEMIRNKKFIDFIQ